MLPLNALSSHASALTGQRLTPENRFDLVPVEVKHLASLVGLPALRPIDERTIILYTLPQGSVLKRLNLLL